MTSSNLSLFEKLCTVFTLRAASGFRSADYKNKTYIIGGMIISGEWCEHASKNLQTRLSEGEYTDLHKAQDACAANQGEFCCHECLSFVPQ